MDACTLYKSEDKETKSFQSMHCCNVLRHQPKWDEKMNQLASQKSCKKKHKASTDSILDLTGNLNDTNEDASPGGDAPKRPIGRKKAKQILRGGGGDACFAAVDLLWEKKKQTDANKELRKEERFNKSLEIEKERLQIERVRAANEQDECMWRNHPA